MKALTGEEMVELLKKHGWYLLRISGSHYIMKKEGLPYNLSIPVHKGKTLKKGLQIFFLKRGGSDTQYLNRNYFYEGENKMQIIDLSLPLKGYGPEPDPPKIKYINHKKGALLLGLGALLCKGNSLVSHLKNFILYLSGTYRITTKDFPGKLGIALEEIKTDTHAGTHLDAPWHFGPTSEDKPAKTIGEIPLEWCYHDGVRLDLRHKKAGEVITVEEIKTAVEGINYRIKPNDIVLIMTGWDKFADSKQYLNHPGMSKEATLWLISQGIKIIGIDTFGFDRGWPVMFDDYIKTRDKKYLWPAHFVGREKEYCHIEKMANLDKIPQAYGFKVACFPINIEKAGAGWVRAVAIIG